MSILEEMMASEHVHGAFDNWKIYRDKVTAFIEKTCPAAKGERPVLAIWGAGRANDIDLKRLSQTYELVLIDREPDAVKEGCQTYGISEKDVTIADLPFWNVDIELYEMFEALLADGADTELLLEILSQVAWDNSHDIRAELYRRFDYSVCIGLHSQLNVRFAGLLYAWRKQYTEEELTMLTQAVRSLNKAAVTRTNDVIYMLTEKRIIYGYEKMTCRERRMLGETIDQWEKRIMNHMPDGAIEEIDGVRELRQDISLHKDADMRICSELRLLWPFDGENKAYLMELIATEKI